MWTWSWRTGRNCNMQKSIKITFFWITHSFLNQSLWNFKYLCILHIQRRRINQNEISLLNGPKNGIFVSWTNVYPLGAHLVSWYPNFISRWLSTCYSIKLVLKGPLLSVNGTKVRVYFYLIIFYFSFEEFHVPHQ